MDGGEGPIGYLQSFPVRTNVRLPPPPLFQPYFHRPTSECAVTCAVTPLATALTRCVLFLFEHNLDWLEGGISEDATAQGSPRRSGLCFMRLGLDKYVGR